MIYEPRRHEALSGAGWDEHAVRAAIERIVADAYSRFDRSRLWPVHPLEESAHPSSTLYFGATGVIWALEYLARVGAVRGQDTFGDVVGTLIERNRAECATMPYPNAASLLMGDIGLQLLRWRLTPNKQLANQLFKRVQTSMLEPVRELMWGTAGTMFASLFMFDWTGESRWQRLYLEQAQRLCAHWQQHPGAGYLWTQDLYGTRARYLGPVHGFAGNVHALLRGQQLLTAQMLESTHRRASLTLKSTAYVRDACANWPAIVDTEAAPAPRLVQYCHGAPGMVVSLATLPGTAVDAVLAQGGELIWKAGPLRKGPGLCHGTAGNGYAFLKLYQRTGESKWLERARAFAMYAIYQCEQARRHYGRGRYSLWTGDLGLAVYLWDCINGEGQFPSLDVF